jgi:hypothetical protein
MAGGVVALAVVDATNQAPLPAGFAQAVQVAPAPLRGLPPGAFISPPGALRGLAPGGQASVSIGPGPARVYIRGAAPGGSGQVTIAPGPAIAQILPPAAVRQRVNFTLPAPGPLGLGIPGSFAQSGEAMYGTVESVGSSSFTIKLHGGQTVTVDKTSSTKYLGTGSPRTVKSGQTVLVVGSPKGAAIDATQVVVLPAGNAKASWTIAP